MFTAVLTVVVVGLMFAVVAVLVGVKKMVTK